MEHERKVINRLSWHREGKFEVEITNGIITELKFCEPGAGADDATGKALTSTDFKFLTNVHECLGELLSFMRDEALMKGHKFATDDTTKVVPIAERRTG